MKSLFSQGFDEPSSWAALGPLSALPQAPAVPNQASTEVWKEHWAGVYEEVWAPGLCHSLLCDPRQRPDPLWSSGSSLSERVGQSGWLKMFCFVLVFVVMKALNTHIHTHTILQELQESQCMRNKVFPQI